METIELALLFLMIKNQKLELTGTSPLEDIEIEADINKKLEKMGIKVPQIRYIREMPQEYSLRHGLPIKVSGALDEFQSDYSAQDDERRKRLANIYGSNYVQDLKEDQRPESMREYLQRIFYR